MALLLKYIDDIQELFDKNGDPRTRNWPMMSSPFPTLIICLAYVYFVKVLGPKVMENRKPLQLKNVLIAYNAFQVVFSAWLFYECLMGGWLNEYSLSCQPVDYSDSPTTIRLSASGWLTGRYSLKCQPVDYGQDRFTIRMVHVCWWYYFSKFTEFMDTIFFVLRKKNQHISTLHVIHHGCMPMSVWFGVKFTPGGHSTFFGLLNTFVHIIMYSYYLLAALGPQMQKYLWWKKYLTSLQMVQFIAIMVHAFQLLFIDCNYPKAFVWWIGMHAVMFFFLFKEFYNQSYGASRAAKLKAQKAAAANGKAANGTSHANGNVHTNGTQQANGKKANGFATPKDYYVNATQTGVNGIVQRHAANGSATA